MQQYEKYQFSLSSIIHESLIGKDMEIKYRGINKALLLPCVLDELNKAIKTPVETYDIPTEV
jgi:hypothetical protein